MAIEFLQQQTEVDTEDSDLKRGKVKISDAEAWWVHTHGTTGFPELLLTRDAISYSQTHCLVHYP